MRTRKAGGYRAIVLGVFVHLLSLCRITMQVPIDKIGIRSTKIDLPDPLDVYEKSELVKNHFKKADVQQVREFYDTFPIRKMEPITEHDRISVIILSYDRPQNFALSLPYLAAMPMIDEIIIAHGNRDIPDIEVPESAKEKTRVLQDFDNNEKIFLFRRYDMKNISPRNDIVLSLDDDHLPTFEFVRSMWNLVRKYSDGASFGPYFRRCDADGYSTKPLTYNFVLPGVLMTRASVFERVFEAMRRLDGGVHFDRVVKQRGEGEDLLFNYAYQTVFQRAVHGVRMPISSSTFEKHTAKRRPKTWSTFLQLDASAGFSTQTGGAKILGMPLEHFMDRNRLCWEISAWAHRNGKAHFEYHPNPDPFDTIIDATNATYKLGCDRKSYLLEQLNYAMNDEIDAAPFECSCAVWGALCPTALKMLNEKSSDIDAMWNPLRLCT